MRAVMAHVITGEREQVAAALRLAHEAGRLAGITDARVLPGERVELVAHLRPANPSRWQRVWPWLIGAVKVAAVLVVVAAVVAVVWAVVSVVLAVIAVVAAVVGWLHAHFGLIVAVAVALLLLVLACAGGASCTGLHCGGCRR